MKKILNNIIYHLRRMSWMFYYPIAILFKNRIAINPNPIFLVGHQGNGATLVSRILRKTNEIVTVTGDKSYLGGADEMQSVMGLCLNKKFTGIIHKVPKINNFSKRNGWFYASNLFIDYYKFGDYDYNKKDENNFFQALRTIQIRSNKKRILDKSQSYLLKIKLINRIIIKHEQIFIIIIRNPLAVCYRAANQKTGLSKQRVNLEKRLKMSTEHWNNCFLEVKSNQHKENVFIFKIEEILNDLEDKMKLIFKCCKLNYDIKYLPKKGDKMGIGSKRTERWFPVKSEINIKNIESTPDWARDFIFQECKEGMKFFNYL